MSVYVAKVHSKLTFPNGYALRSELSWTYYRLLMRVENDNARQFLYGLRILKSRGKSDEAYHSKSIFRWYDGLSRW